MKTISEPRERLAFALDVPSEPERIFEKLFPVLGKTEWVKINSVYTGYSRDFAMDLILSGGSSPFVDIKIHDISIK